MSEVNYNSLCYRCRINAGKDSAGINNNRLCLSHALEENSSLRAQVAENKKEIKILELKNQSSLANNLCPDHRDKQKGKVCLACTIEKLEAELATLRERAKGIEDFYSKWHHLGADTNSDIMWQAIKTFAVRIATIETELAEKEKLINNIKAWFHVHGETNCEIFNGAIVLFEKDGKCFNEVFVDLGREIRKQSLRSEKAEAELATLREKAKGIEEVYALIKSDFNNCFNSKEMDVIQANAVKMWQAIKPFTEGT